VISDIAIGQTRAAGQLAEKPTEQGRNEPVGVDARARWWTAPGSTGDDGGMGGYTYDELVRLHDQMTWQLGELPAEGLIEFHVDQRKGVIEVLVNRQYDHEALNALVAGIPGDAYEVLETADSAEGAGVSPARRPRGLLGGLGRFMGRAIR
jgi:hypothetical protein